MKQSFYKHQSMDGLSSTNLIYDKDALVLALAGVDNAEEILGILSQSLDREDNGFRNMKQEKEEGFSPSNIESSDSNDAGDDPLHQLIAEESGTAYIVDHLSFYLGDNRAWRNGWNVKSFHRHIKATRKAQADNGIVWGDYSMIPTKEEKATKAVNKASLLAVIEERAAKRKSKALKRMARLLK